MNKALNSDNAYGVIPGLARIFRRRGLLNLFVSRYVRSSYQGSYLGLFWLTITPLLLMSMYAFVFGIVFNGRYRGGIGEETGIDYALGLFVSLTLFHLFSDSMNASTTTITNNSNLVKKVVFPLEILPEAVVGAQLAQFLVSMSLVVIALLITGHNVTLTWLCFPLLFVPVLLMALGISYLFSVIGVFVRDITQVTRVLGTVLLFGSAIFFSTDNLPSLAKEALQFNPLVHAVEQSRAIFLWGEFPNIGSLIYLNSFSVFIFVVGFWAFQQGRAYIADLL